MPSVAGSVLRFPVIPLVVLFWLFVGHLVLWPLFVAAFLWFRVGAGRHRQARWGYDGPERSEADDSTTYV